MTGRLYAIALNTFREAIRNKMLYGIMLMVILMNGFALVLGQMSLHEEVRVARDTGLAGVSLFGAFTAIVLGVSMLYTEVHKKTIHNILSKPMQRYEFVLGKYVGMVFTLTVLVVLFALAMAVMLWFANLMTPYKSVEFTQATVKAVVLGYMEVLIIAAIAIFFSSFSTPFLSGIFTFGIFAAGRASSAMAEIASSETPLALIGSVGSKLVPNLNLFAISGGQVDGSHVSVHGQFIGWDYVSSAGLVAAGWIGGLLLVSMVIFSRRDFI